MRRALAALAAVLLTAALTSAAPVSAAPEPAVAKWTTEVFSSVPAPGYPAYVHAHTNGRVYAGSYIAGSSTMASRVFEWSREGVLLRSWTVPGQVLDADHGVQVANQTRDGLLVLLETSTRTVQTLDTRTGRFRVIATFPEGAVPNYATWGPGGALYVTDYAQPIIWRLGRKDRTPQEWFTSTALSGAEFGTTGLRYRPAERDLVIAQQWVLDGTQLPVNGAVYSLPIAPGGAPGELAKLWTSGPMELPDGFGIGRSGHLYVSLLGTNQLVELSAEGEEVDRFPDTPLAGDNGSAIAFDTPCSATFLGTTVLVANQSAITGTAGNQAILQVEVGERGQAAYLPKLALLR
ncbi:MAG: hypothetical protein F2667_09910 [Actinobacteria bacterium]|uniref:Unannotated protein n=1 Tax=freshwater metagenome TaxID=449393 RepID=A0A6J6RFI1_9ZZZZ|nr:hypothetical protein [Actinomycetota bacterium]